MKHLTRLIYVIFAVTAIVWTAAGTAAHAYHPFDNLGGRTSHLCIRDITQTADGMMWFAAESGLYSYDGYHLTGFKYSSGKKGADNKSRGSYNCIIASGDSLIIGCNSGVLSFHYSTGTFHTLPYAEGETVCGIELADGQLWVATDKGLYRNGQKLPMGIEGTVSIDTDGDIIYIGRANGVSRYSVATRSMESLTDDIEYAACILNGNGQLWVGSATAVTRIDTKSGEKRLSMPMPVAKCMLRTDDSKLLIGTDDGLYMAAPDGTRTERIAHDARYSSSLAGNAVWSIFKDRDGNIWTGTDAGISLIKADGAMTVYPLPVITGYGNGNRLTTVFADSRRRLWLGGAGGLLCVEGLGTDRQTSRWYRMNDIEYPIRHNHVRCVMETTDGNIVVGGDMGLMIYEDGTRQFRQMALGTDDTEWIYDIEETANGDLLLTTFTATYTVSIGSEQDRVTIKSRHKRRNLSAKAAAGAAMLRRYGMEGRFLSAYHDDKRGITLLGGNDCFALIRDPEGLRTGRTPMFTGIKVNGGGWRPLIKEGGMHAELPADVSFVEVMFSDFDYSGLMPHEFQYRLDNGRWLPVRSSDCTVMLTGLTAGKHILTVRSTGKGRAQADVTLYVKPRWYASAVAKTFYTLLGFLLTYLTWLFYRQRRRLKRERFERQMVEEKARETEERMGNENRFLTTRLRIQQHDKGCNGPELSADEKFLTNITDIIKANMADTGFNVDSLCRLSGTGSKLLYRKIKAMTGLTTVAYIRSLRMQKAAALLAKGTMTVSEVMYAVGFSSPSYFTKCFQEEHGMPPSEYRP